MAGYKIISATAKEPVINVSDGAKVATAEVKEIVSNLSGFGEGWILDPTLFTFRQDKSIVNEYFSKSVSRPAKDIVGSVKTDIRIIAAKLIPDTLRTSDTFSRIVAFERVISDTKNTVEVLAKSSSKVLKDTADQVEEISKAFSTTLANDLTSSSDKATLLFGLYKTDTTRTSDVFSRIVSYNRTLTDWIDATDDFFGSANIDDDQYAWVYKTTVEYADLVETLAKVMTTTLTSDKLNGVIEVASKTMSLVKADTKTVSDTRVLSVAKAVNDITDQIEQIQKAFSTFHTEVADANEFKSIGVSKTVVDVVDQAETFGKTLSLIKSDLIDPVEVFNKAGSKVINDAISKVEHKIAHMQHYFSGDYIAADYVGTNYTI